MTKDEMVLKVARIRGLEDRYTLIIGKFAEDPQTTEAEVRQMMYDILLGINN